MCQSVTSRSREFSVFLGGTGKSCTEKSSGICAILRSRIGESGEFWEKVRESERQRQRKRKRAREREKELTFSHFLPKFSTFSDPGSQDRANSATLLNTNSIITNVTITIITMAKIHRLRLNSSCCLLLVISLLALRSSSLWWSTSCSFPYQCFLHHFFDTPSFFITFLSNAPSALDLKNNFQVHASIGGRRTPSCHPILHRPGLCHYIIFIFHPCIKCVK